MVEKMLDLDGVARGQGKAGKKVADPVGEADAAFGRELLEQSSGHQLADRADLEQGSGVIGERASTLAKPKFMTWLNPSGMVTPSVIPGRRKCRRCASP